MADAPPSQTESFPEDAALDAALTHSPELLGGIVQLAAAAPRAAGEQGVRLDLRSGAGDTRVRADAGRLQQALGNLLGNAIKFTPRGGRVTLSAALGTGVVRFAVADTGPGIPTERLPHVFDRFWQARETRRRGAGLGLAVVKGIVEAHDGTLGVDSTPGVGSRFWLAIPAAR